MKSYLPKNWSVKKSAEYCLRVTDGTHDTPKPIDEGKLLITSKNIKEGRVQLDGAYAISQNDFDEINRRSKVDQWDVLFSMIGTVGEIALVRNDPDYAIKNIGLFKNKTKVDGMWLYYYLTSSIGKAALETYLTGTSQQFVSLGDLRKVPVIDPDETSKVNVSAVLAAYDDLIENNRRRIALLEKMAEEIYREWFVRMRFPGHEQAKFEKGVPEGWDCDVASKFFEHVKGKSYAGDELTENPDHMPFITLKSFNRGGGYRADGLKRYSGKYKEEQVVQRGDVVMAVTDMTQNREVVGRAARIPEIGEKGAVISLDVIKLTPKTVSASFLYSYMRLSGFGEFIKEFANGTNVLHLKPDLVTRQKIVIPPKELRERFVAIVDPIYDKIDSLNEAVDRLSASRDVLLPRLISGRLAVEKLDIRFPPGMLSEAGTREPQAVDA
ncbi:MAG: restriction endonuclease subunit S [Gammaproteobacteria bacterium]|nr:restriction endonuclease subunit S [Gammaproteobacteria bacterium]